MNQTGTDLPRRPPQHSIFVPFDDPSDGGVLLVWTSPNGTVGNDYELKKALKAAAVVYYSRIENVHLIKQSTYALGLGELMEHRDAEFDRLLADQDVVIDQYQAVDRAVRWTRDDALVRYIITAGVVRGT